MPKILFWPDIHFETGHWRPMLAMADKVRQQPEFEVGFLCTPECQPIIDNCGLTPVPSYNVVLTDLYKVGYSSLIFEKPEEAHSRIEHCLRIAEGELDAVINAFQPDILIAGYFIALEALLIQNRYNRSAGRNMKVIISTTFLRHPNEDPYITSLRFLGHHSQEVSSRLMKAAAPDAENNEQFDGSFDSIKEFVHPLDTVRELITCPEVLDHPEHVQMHRPDTHYVEPSILDTSGNQTKDPKLIYASAGSRVRDYVEGARTLFRMLRTMVNLNAAGTRKLEMAVGYALKEEFSNSQKIKIIDWADQTESLKRARSAVVHGGLATIKECIYFGIPPIIVPLGKDQMDNALRVANKKVGSFMMLDTLNEQKLYDTILAAETNLEVQRNIEKMQNIFMELEHPSGEDELPPSLVQINLELGIA